MEKSNILKHQEKIINEMRAEFLKEELEHIKPGIKTKLKLLNLLSCYDIYKTLDDYDPKGELFDYMLDKTIAALYPNSSYINLPKHTN